MTVAVLAAVIIGVAALSPSEDAPAPKISLQTAPSSQSVQLTEQGEQALAAGDEAGAVALANQALKADPTNQAARALLTKATTPSSRPSGSQGSGSSNKGSSGGTGSGSPGPNPDTGYTKKLSNMGKSCLSHSRSTSWATRGHPKRGTGLRDTCFRHAGRPPITGRFTRVRARRRPAFRVGVSKKSLSATMELL